MEQPVASRGFRPAAVFLLACLLYLPGLVLHESLHAAVVLALGHRPGLVVRPWRFALLDLAPPSLHVQALPSLAPAQQVADNLLGPALAGLLVAALWLRAQSPLLRAALAANLAILAFYALVETADVLLEWAGRDLPLLTVPEFDYGVPLGVCLLFALLPPEGLSRTGPGPR